MPESLTYDNIRATIFSDPMTADYVKLAQTYLHTYPSRQQSYFAALTRFTGESTQTISSNWLKAEYLRHKLRKGSYLRIARAAAKVHMTN